MVSWLVHLTPDQVVWTWSGFESWLKTFVVLLGKTLCCHSASLYVGVQIGTGKFTAEGMVPL